MDATYLGGKRKTSSNTSDNVQSESSTESRLSLNIVKPVIFEPRAKYTVYKINVCNEDGRRWLVHRRYSDFVLLNKKLQRLFQDITLHLPPKRWFLDNFNTNFIKKRQEGLQTFLGHVFERENLYRCDPIQQFFRLDKPPDPAEDLEACRRQCEMLMENCNTYKMNINQQGQEITRLTREIEDWSTQNETDKLDRATATRSFLMQKEELERQIHDLNNHINKKNNEIVQLHEGYRQRETLAENERKRERDARQAQIAERETRFREKQKNLEALYNDIANSISELGSISVGIGGRSIDLLTTASLNDQGRDLRRAMEESRNEIESLYHENMAFFRQELENAEARMARKENDLQTTFNQLNEAERNLIEATRKHEEDARSSDFLIRQYQTQLATQTSYTKQIEEKYFYALVLGVKLNMILCDQMKELSKVQLESRKLYFIARDNPDLDIINWPAWIERYIKEKLAALAQPLPPSSPPPQPPSPPLPQPNVEI